MRILLDEDVPIRLRHYFPDAFSVETVEYRGWKNLDNGDLLRRAEQHFDAFLTIDKGVSEQQNLDVSICGLFFTALEVIRLMTLPSTSERFAIGSAEEPSG